MPFEIFTAAQYRSLDLDGLETRLSAVIAELENPESTVEFDVLEEQCRLCKAEFDIRNKTAELRKLQVEHVIASEGNIIAKSASKEERKAAVNKFGSEEYRNAFMEYTCRGVELPIEYRATADTTGAGAVIPTTLMSEIIRKLEEYGEIWAKVRKLNVKGGVEFPILSLTPVAHWVTEAAPSADQDVTANTKVSFTYHMIECKMAQTLLLSVVSLDEFERVFPQLAVEAIVKGLETAIIAGSGSGEPLGIINDNRIPAGNKRTMGTSDFNWQGWKTALSAKKSYRKGAIIVAQETWDMYMDGMVDADGQPIARVNYGVNGEESYRFMGKEVITVETDLLPDFDSASSSDVFAIFVDLKNYAVNSNMQMTVTKWQDHDANKVKNKATMVVDGKLLDANGAILIAKA